jgi:hypothetical protein
VYSKAEVTDSIAVARHACQGGGELEVVGVCSGSWYAAQVARHVGAQSAILVNLVAWNWRVAPTWLSQWSFRKQTLQSLHPDAGSVPSGGPSKSRTAGLKALLNQAREPAMVFIHNLPRYVVRVLSWVGLLWLPEAVLTTLARRGTAVTVIASPEDAERFTARGGPATLDRLQRTSHPPHLIAAPAGDHAANHPAMLALIRNAVLPLSATPSGREHDDLQIGVGA